MYDSCVSCGMMFLVCHDHVSEPSQRGRLILQCDNLEFDVFVNILRKKNVFWVKILFVFHVVLCVHLTSLKNERAGALILNVYNFSMLLG